MSFLSWNLASGHKFADFHFISYANESNCCSMKSKYVDNVFEFGTFSATFEYSTKCSVIKSGIRSHMKSPHKLNELLYVSSSKNFLKVCSTSLILVQKMIRFFCQILPWNLHLWFQIIEFFFKTHLRF